MTRDSEDKWWNSMLTQIESTKNMAILLTFMRYFNPTFRSMVQQSERASECFINNLLKIFWKGEFFIGNFDYLPPL